MSRETRALTLCILSLLACFTPQWSKPGALYRGLRTGCRVLNKMVPFRVTCEQFETQLGCRIKAEWFEAVRSFVEQDRSSETDRLNLLFAHFLEADMNLIGAGSFPAGSKVSFQSCWIGNASSIALWKMLRQPQRSCIPAGVAQKECRRQMCCSG